MPNGEQKKSSNWIIWYILIIALLIVLIAIWYYMPAIETWFTSLMAPATVSTGG